MKSKEEWALERLGFTQVEIHINKNFFRVGRTKDNDVVCPSLEVSREHCMFTKVDEGLFVQDLGSSNGVFVNGNMIKQKVPFKLKLNDCIGIGCGMLNNLKKENHVYKLKNKIVSNDSNCPDSTTSTNDESKRLLTKEHSRSRVEEPVVLIKKLKTETIEIDDEDDDIKIIDCEPNSSNEKDVPNDKEIPSPKQNSETSSNGKVASPSSLVASETNKTSSSHEIPDIINLSDDDDIGENLIENDCHPQVLLNNIKDEPMQVDEIKTDDNITGHIKTEPRDNIESDRQEDDSKDELNFNFSQMDIIELDDEDADMYPQSQLMDRSVVKNEVEDSEDLAFSSNMGSLYDEDDEDQNIITILDSDDDADFPVNSIPKKEPTCDETNNLDPLDLPVHENLNLPVSCPLQNDVTDEDPENPNHQFYYNIPTSSENIEETLLEIIEHKRKSLSRENEDLLLENRKIQTNLLKKKDKSPSKDSSFIDGKSEKINELFGDESSSTNKVSMQTETSNEITESTIEPSSNDDPLLLNEFNESSNQNNLIKKKHSGCKGSPISNGSKTSQSKTKKSIQIIEPHHIKVKKKSKSKETKSKSDEKSKKKKRKKDRRSPERKNEVNENNDSSINSANESNNESSLSEQKKNNENNLCPTSNYSLSAEIESMRPRCKTTLVKVKVSKKSRNDLLCETMQNLRPKPKHKKPELEPKKPEPSKPPYVPTFVIPRRQVPSSSLLKESNSSNISKSTDDSVGLSIPSSNTNETTLSTVPSHNINFYGSKSSKSTDTTNQTSSTFSVLSNTINHLDLPPYSPDRNDRVLPTIVDTDVEFSENLPNLRPSIAILSNPRKKRVTFKEGADISTVREYNIPEGHNLRNIKDGLSLRSTKKDFSKILDLKTEDFLARIFAWEPVWLEQQQKVKSLPPIVKESEKQNLPNTFKSYSEYYKRMETLLLMETWQYLVKEYECNGTRYNSSIALPCTLDRMSFRQMSTPNGLRYSTLNLQCLVTDHQYRMKNPPVYGDMIIIEYAVKQNPNEKRKVIWKRAFGYVIEVQKQGATRFLSSNSPLCRLVPKAEALLTFFIQTRVIDEQTVQFDQVARLRSVFYLRSHLRLIQALHYVPHSALRDLILSVDVDEFQLDDVPPEEISSFKAERKLVTNENLNQRQLEAVIKFTNASVKLEPKIGLLIGPPGTGKSKVIANLVTQILYGDGRFTSGQPPRILVCAPSNAAIDEIVLRLLDIRQAIDKDHRFKMIRIGRIESMHEEVKKISVSELAKREASRAFTEQQHKNTESTEMQKHQLRKEIEALQMLVMTNPHNKRYQKDLEDHRAKLNKISTKNPDQEAQEFNKLQNNAKAILVQRANVITCTLSSCYTGQMENIFGGNSSHKIPTCIVDEATQCCEAETLIPLMLGVKNLILVGDPNQLPATVMSTDAKKLGLDRSLFTRTKEALEPQFDEEKRDCRDPIITLNEQYRMVNPISYWPNQYFYNGKLIDRVNYKQSFPFHPYRLLNLDGLQDDIKFSNTSEAEFVGNLLNCMMTCSDLRKWEKTITVGIITPYQNQKSVISAAIKERTKYVSNKILNKFIIEVNTIDSFQGQERDVIVMSCVRSSGIGFMSDQQRLCVALTRAKMSLIICGNLETFQNNSMWQNLVYNARSRGLVARLPTTAKPNDIKKHVISI